VSEAEDLAADGHLLAGYEVVRHGVALALQFEVVGSHRSVHEEAICQGSEYQDAVGPVEAECQIAIERVSSYDIVLRHPHWPTARAVLHEREKAIDILWSQTREFGHSSLPSRRRTR